MLILKHDVQLPSAPFALANPEAQKCFGISISLYKILINDDEQPTKSKLIASRYKHKQKCSCNCVFLYMLFNSKKICSFFLSSKKTFIPKIG